MNFVSETDVAEQRKTRQEEWERVRKADDPKEAPEAEYDPRCLFDQLQEHKDKKQEEFDEKIKFKNQFRGIDSEEADFLTDMANRANKLAKQKRLDEENEIIKLQNNVVVVSTPSSDPTSSLLARKKNEEKLNQALQSKNKNKKSQYELLKGAIKRKSTMTTTMSDGKSSSKVAKPTEECSNDGATEKTGDVVISPPTVKCAGFLPGIGTYDSSDDSSDQTSDEESGV